jgi:adenylosuccinate lyase
MKAWNKKEGSFKQNLMTDENVTKVVSKEEIEQCFDAKSYLKNIDTVFQRLGI